MKALKSRTKTLSHTSSAGVEFPVKRVAATEAKNRFGGVLAGVEAGEVVAIVRHNTPTAVIMPMGEYRRLSNAASRKLNLLTEEFDALLARMQTPQAGVAMAAAFHATSAEMGKSAVAAVAPSASAGGRKSFSMTPAARRKHG